MANFEYDFDLVDRIDTAIHNCRVEFAPPTTLFITREDWEVLTNYWSGYIIFKYSLSPRMEYKGMRVRFICSGPPCVGFEFPTSCQSSMIPAVYDYSVEQYAQPPIVGFTPDLYYQIASDH